MQNLDILELCIVVALAIYYTADYYDNNNTPTT